MPYYFQRNKFKDVDFTYGINNKIAVLLTQLLAAQIAKRGHSLFSVLLVINVSKYPAKDFHESKMVIKVNHKLLFNDFIFLRPEYLQLLMNVYTRYWHLKNAIKQKK
jgi:hypothetical protein